MLSFFVIQLLQSLAIAVPISSVNNQINEQLLCNNVNYENHFYTMELQRNISGVPADMSVQWKTGYIFFTHISNDMQMCLRILKPNGDIDTIEVDDLGQSSTVDNLNNIVYLATNNGVFKYVNKSVIPYTANGEDVMYLAVNYLGTKMYIATFPQNRVHEIDLTYETMKQFPQIPNGHGITIDRDNNIYFVATKTSYVFNNEKGKKAIKIEGLPNDIMTGIFVSASGKVYAMDQNSNLYLVDGEAAKATKLAYFGLFGVNSFAMDAFDNILIGVKGCIYKFKHFDRNPCTSPMLFD